MDRIQILLHDYVASTFVTDPQTLFMFSLVSGPVLSVTDGRIIVCLP